MSNAFKEINSIPFADSDQQPCTSASADYNFSMSVNGNSSLDTILCGESLCSAEELPSSAVHAPAPGANLRRNSISMPVGLNAVDLERLQNANMERNVIIESHPESVTDDNGAVCVKISTENKCTSSEDDSDLEEKKPIYQNRFRSRRRASIAPLPALRLNDKTMLASDLDASMGNQASITSVNSLAGLLKEKMQAFPQLIRKKKKETKDYKIKIFVTILFFIIIFLIGYAYVSYHQKILSKTYFRNAKFNEKKRSLRIFDFNDVEIMKGELGVTLGFDTAPFNCLSEDRLRDGSICMEWNQLARLYMNFENLDVFRCYTIKWQALGHGVYPTDCFDLSRENGHWFGGGVTKDFDWSLNTADFDYSPFISGDIHVHQFSNALKRYFINSVGVAIQVSEKTPLHVAVNKTANSICLRAMNDEFGFVNRLTPLPELSYKLCIAGDMKSLHMLMTQKSLWDGLKEGDIKSLNSLIEEPVWKIPSTNDSSSLNETSIYNYSEEIIAMGYMRLGHILVNEYWQENIGDFTLDEKRFPTFKDTVDVLHRRGFKVVLTIQPFISTDSPNFKEAVQKKLLIYERYSERSIPALTRYKSLSSAGVLDITNNDSIPWLSEKLMALKNKYQVDGFYLDSGVAYNLPHYYQCRKTLDNPDEYARIFASSLDGIGLLGTSTATVVPRPPAFVSVPPMNSSWSSLREIVTFAVNYGIIGYPFVLSGAVGGDYLRVNRSHKMITFKPLDTPPLPSQELYIRWLQLVTFLPSMQFNHLPSEYKSDYVKEVSKELHDIRQKTVVPLLKKYLRESMDDGLPLVRPLWMLDAEDPACLMVNDEFSIGEELIIAPILEEGLQRREVYLPQGVWKDGVDGSLRKGSRWIHNYFVPKDKIAYFVKLPDNTRF